MVKNGHLSSIFVFSVILGYFALLMVIAYFTSRKNTEDSFFTGDRKSPWFLVAFGMIGAALSGVTFVSIPGMVGNNHLYFLQFILGNVAGYFFITFILIPLYYKLRLVSIYEYLKERFGFITSKTGALLFLTSQSFGAALRLLLATKILQFAFFDSFHIPFFLTVTLILILVWLYTNKSGIKTIVWTDTLQTFFLIAGAGMAVYSIMNSFDLSFSDTLDQMVHSKYFNLFNWETNSKNNFYKQFISGILIAVAMIGLDQNMMQKTLTCKDLRAAQKNMLVYSLILAATQFLFLCLGVLLYLYAEKHNIQLTLNETGHFLDTDTLFPNIALNHLGIYTQISFLLGIIAASFSSIDSALTALTTSFTYDFLNLPRQSQQKKKKLKNRVFIGFLCIIFLIIMLFSQSRGDIISVIFRVAGYTYGPLLGLYLFGIFTPIRTHEKWTPIICILSPLLTYLLEVYSEAYFQFNFGFINILVNALLTLIGLLILKKK